MLRYKSNKKGQIGETLTWIIATIIIVGVVLIFIWISFLISKVKAINAGDAKIDVEKESGVLAGKTYFAEQLTKNKDKPMIEEMLKKINGGKA